MHHTYRAESRQGFTIVELAVVIVVIGMLAALLIFSIGGWRAGLARDQVFNDLNAAEAAMVSARNFGTGYPTALPTTYKESQNVTMRYAYGNASLFCIDATSKEVPSVVYYLMINGNTNGEPVEGNCP